MSTQSPDFRDLSESEQRAVAERLLRIEESGWKPFWCPNPKCSGDPHWAVVDEPDGTKSNIFVSETDQHGPNGEPVGPVLVETQDGELVERDDPRINWAADLEVVGRPVLDPKWAHNHARVDQRLPSWKKRWTLFIMSGRGAGKTRTGVEFVTLCARKGLDGAILGRRGTELVNTHVAEIIANAHPEFVPVHWSSKDILEWPNGAITYLFSAEKPENIRSVNLSYAWVDEAAFMDEIETAWMNLTLATRVKSPGNPIHMLITSTPTGTPWVMKMEDDPDIEVRRVSTYANKANLDSEWLAQLEKEHEGTRMGRQEIHGEVLRDVEGALWNDDMFKHLRVSAAEYQTLLDGMDDRVLAVDPAGSKGKRSDATGIIGVGAQHFDDDGSHLARSNLFVLGRATIKGTPTEWAERVFSAARLMRVSRIVAEKNYGGDMVKQVLSDYAALNPEKARDENGEEFRITVVHAVQNKETRAEGVVGKYEQGCIDGEALVPTQRGVIPLREVSRNDSVLTRFGLRRVLAVLDQGVRDVVEVTTTEGTTVMTDDHEVYTSTRGWVHACDLVPTDTIVAWEKYVSTAGPIQRVASRNRAVTLVPPSTCGALGSPSESFRSTTASATTSKKMGTGEQGGTQVENSSIALSGWGSEARSPRVGTSTTSTMTRATTLWATLNRSLRVSIQRITTQRAAGTTNGRTPPRSLVHGLVRRGPASAHTRTWPATNAAPLFKASSRTPDSAIRPVTRAGGIVSVKPAGRRHVYDLTVEEHPEFFANGFLVHNCVTHVTSPTAYGDLSELEKQQVTWVPKSRGGRMPSPNDIDALVWAVRELETKVKFTTSMGTMSSALGKMKKTPQSVLPLNTGVAGPKGRRQAQFPAGIKKRIAAPQRGVPVPRGVPVNR